MKKHGKKPLTEDTDTMRPEYDFSKGVRGKHADKYDEGTNHSLGSARCPCRSFALPSGEPTR